MEACSQTVGIAETALSSKEDQLRVTPLQGDASWYVHFPHIETWTLAVYNALGRQVWTKQSHGSTVEMDLGSAAPGVYLLRASEQDGLVLGAKVVRR